MAESKMGGEEFNSPPSRTDPVPPQYTSPPTARRETGYNSNGDPELYASDLEGYMQQYGLTKPEAAAYWQAMVDGENSDTALDNIRNARTIYMPVMVAVPATPGNLGGLVPESPPTPDTPTAALVQGE